MMKLKEMCKTLRLAYVSDIYADVPYEDPAQFLESIFQRELELREEAKAGRLIKRPDFYRRNPFRHFNGVNRFISHHILILRNCVHLILLGARKT